MLVRAIYSDVITVSVRSGHFVGVARLPPPSCMRAWTSGRYLRLVIGSYVIDCGTDWRAVRDSAYVLSL